MLAQRAGTGILPAVQFEEYAQKLAQRLSQPLPGPAAQARMAPRGRVDTDYRYAPEAAKHGAVLILLFDRGAGPELPLIVRTDDGTAHGGQIGLPGGGFEPGDAFPIGTAVREAEEEIGARDADIQILGVLTPLYVWVSNYYIIPVVGAYTGDPQEFRANPLEVQRILVAPVEELRHGSSRRTVDARGVPMQVPVYGFDGSVVWGATAMMLSEFFVCHEEVHDNR